MKRSSRLLGLVAILLSQFVDSTATAQLIAEKWQSYTSMRGVNAIALERDSNTFWAVTTGGVFRGKIAARTDSLVPMRNTDGISDNYISAIAVGMDGTAYLGGQGGTLDIVHAGSGKVTRERGIAEVEELTRKKINQLYIAGDRLYIAASFGLSVYDLKSRTFISTITGIADRPEQDSVIAVVEHGGRIYALFRDALAYTSRAEFSLRERNNWKLIAIPERSMRTMVSYRDALLIGGDTALFVMVEGVDTLRTLAAAPSHAVALVVSPSDSLHILTQDGGMRLFATRDLLQYRESSLPAIAGRATALAVGREGSAIGTTEEGVVVETEFGVRKLQPAGPPTNEVVHLHFATSRRELIASLSSAGVSIMSDDGSWISRSFRNSPLPNSDYTSALYDSVHNVHWLSTSGSEGVVRVAGLTTGNPEVTLFNATTGFPKTLDDGYIVAGHGHLDTRGNFAVTSFANDGRGLSFTSDGENFTHVQLRQFNTYLSYARVTSDLSGNYWIGTKYQNAPQPAGVFWMRRKDGKVGELLAGPGAVLPDPNVNALLVDQDNALWVGSNSGVQIVYNSSDINFKDNPSFFQRSVAALESQVVSSMVVDGVGNKWIGTDQGVFVVSSDGTEVLATFTTANSPIIANQVLTLAVDPPSGIVYIGTRDGISAVTTIYREGKPTYENFRAYPNPVVLDADGMTSVYFDNLVGGSVIKVYSIAGKLVATIDASDLGSKASWNARDEVGRPVESGIYIVSAVTREGTEAGRTKIVIVRK